MRNICLSLSVFALAFAFSGCSKNNNGPSNVANVMFVNGCNGTANIDTKIDGSKLTVASNMGYFYNSGYQPLTGGSKQAINFFLTNQGTPLISDSISLTAGDNYTVYAGGIVTSPTFVVTTDSLTAPATGNAKVRFINLSSDTLNESFSIGSQALDSNITTSKCTPFYQITATSGVEVFAADPNHLVGPYTATLTNQAFVAGKIYTIMLTGTHLGSGNAVLTLTVINNN